MSRTVFKTEEKVSRSEASEKMQKIAEGLQKGEISMDSGSDSVELRPSESCEFEVKVEEESDGEISLEVEIEWNDRDEGSLQVN